MYRYRGLREINKVLEKYRHEFIADNMGGLSVPHEAVLFKKPGVGHISILMTNHGCYELVSYNEKTGVYHVSGGHTEEFIDRIMEGADVMKTGRYDTLSLSRSLWEYLKGQQRDDERMSDCIERLLMQYPVSNLKPEKKMQTKVTREVRHLINEYKITERESPETVLRRLLMP